MSITRESDPLVTSTNPVHRYVSPHPTLMVYTVVPEPITPIIDGPSGTSSMFQSDAAVNNNQKKDDSTNGDSASGNHSLSRTSNLATMMHIMKGNIGTGILAMPSAFKNSGLAVGSVALPIMGVIAISCMHMLVKCQEELCSRLKVTFLDYEDVAQKSFELGPGNSAKYSKIVRKVVMVFLMITQLGFCCVYGLFAAETVKEVIWNQLGIEWKTQIILLCLLPVMIALNLIRSLKGLAVLSTTANVLQMCGMVYLFSQLVQDLPHVSSVPLVNDIGKFPLFFGTAIYAFEGIGIVLPIKKAMSEPGTFGGVTGVLNTSMVIISCLYFGMGFFGFLKFSDDVQGNIALNLPPGTSNDLCRLAFGVAIFFSYPLQAYVPFEIMWPSIKAKFCPNSTDARKARVLDIIMRVTLVTVTFIIGASVDQLDLFISLVGAFSSSSLALIFPPIFDTLVFWTRRGVETSAMNRTIWLLKNIFISACGIVGFMTGTYASILNLIDYFSTKHIIPHAPHYVVHSKMNELFLSNGTSLY